MRVLIVCLGFTLCIALVCGESCSTVADCDQEVCHADGWSKACTHGICTCDHAQQTGQACLSLADCTKLDCQASGGWGGRWSQTHCVDSKCTCSWWGGK